MMSTVVIWLVAALVGIPWLALLVFPFVYALFIPFAGVSQVAQMSQDRSYRKPKILVVDDDEISVSPLLSVLSDKIADITWVGTIEQMLFALEHTSFDLIFLDRMMPVMTGDEALQVEDEKNLPDKKFSVVFFSNYAKNLSLPQYKHFDVKGIWDKKVSYRKLNEKVESIWNEVAA